MSANVQANKDQYISLMRRFVSSEIDGKTFQSKFFEMRRRDVNRDEELKKSWPQPYDEQLLSAYRRGDITGEEFHKKWQELWGYQSTKWLDVFDTLTSDVNYLVDDEEYEKYRQDSSQADSIFYLNENGLREKVEEYLTQLEAWGELS